MQHEPELEPSKFLLAATCHLLLLQSFSIAQAEALLQLLGWNVQQDGRGGVGLGLGHLDQHKMEDKTIYEHTDKAIVCQISCHNKWTH